MPKPKTAAREWRRAARAQALRDIIAALDRLTPSRIPANLAPLYTQQVAKIRELVSRSSLIRAREPAHWPPGSHSDSRDAADDEPQRTS